jgi:hypothetical protein
VRLTGPLKHRVSRVAAEEKLAPAVADRRVRDYDRETRARIETLYKLDLDEPTNFDLVVNTYALPLTMLAKMLAGLALEIDETIQPEDWQQMRDAAVAAEVRAALMLHPKIGHTSLEVHCVEGLVQVNGPGLVRGAAFPGATDLSRVHAAQAALSDSQSLTVRPASPAQQMDAIRYPIPLSAH